MKNFKERLAESQAKMNELKEKINDAAETAQIAGMLAKDDIKQKITELEADMDAFDQAIDDQIDDDIATIQGDINALSENARLARERSKSQFNAAKLKAQMSITAAKEKITEKKEARDKAKQEQRILDLLDYADNCQSLALAMALESKLAILEAVAEAADYESKYNK